MNTFAHKKRNTDQLTEALWRDPWVYLACGFGAGALPLIPGTFGSLVALLLYFVIAHWPLWAYVLACLVVAVVAVLLCRYILASFDVDDPGEACIDEFPGMLVTFIGIPTGHWHYVLLGFILFRFFDMVKPWPVGWLDRNIHGGFGMVLDDVVAGAIACVALHILTFWLL